MEETVVATEVQQQTKQKINVGLIMPIAEIEGLGEQHWEDIRIIINEALKDNDKFEMNLRLVSHSDEVRVIQTSIVQNIYNDDIVIIDVSAKNANVMFEFGMRLAFDKAFVVIKDDITPYIFDTGNIQHLEYPRDLRYTSIENFKVNLRKKVISTLEYALTNSSKSMYLEQYGNLKPAKIEEKEVSETEYLQKTLDTIRNDFKRLEKNVLNGTKRTSKSSFKLTVDNSEELYQTIFPFVSKYFEGYSLDDIKYSDNLLNFLIKELNRRSIYYSEYLLNQVLGRAIDEVFNDNLPF